MICDACNKNEATVRLVAVIDGVKTERHLCTDCVEKQKQRMRAEGMQSMLSAIISGARRASSQRSNLRCSYCGLSYDEFRKTSRLGCAQCYQDFRTQLKPVLQRLHGATQHVGRVPEQVDEALKRSNQIDRLRREMEIAVACEDFENAAQIRDELRQMTAAEEGCPNG